MVNKACHSEYDGHTFSSCVFRPFTVFFLVRIRGIDRDDCSIKGLQEKQNAFSRAFAIYTWVDKDEVLSSYLTRFKPCSSMISKSME